MNPFYDSLITIMKVDFRLPGPRDEFMETSSDGNMLDVLKLQANDLLQHPAMSASAFSGVRDQKLLVFKRLLTKTSEHFAKCGLPCLTYEWMQSFRLVLSLEELKLR